MSDLKPQDETLALATFLSELIYEQLPAEVIEHAKACILNALGCALGSANAEPRRKAIEALIFDKIERLGVSQGATVIGRGERVDVQTAAFLNGVAITTSDYDDTHLRTVIHPSGTPLAAILPWAEVHHLSGKEVILALVVGIEAQCAVGNAISPSHYADGWHITGTTGTFGAAAGMAKLLKLPPKQFSDALGHATSMASGTRAAFGTDTKTLHMGRGAQNGIIAARLAQSGFSSCSSPIEAWAPLVSSTVNSSLISEKARGGSWQILENTFKPYPCGIVIHPLIDGCLEIFSSFPSGDEKNESSSDETLTSLKEIDSIEVVVNPQCVRLCNVRHPRSGLETIFSLYHGCAVALVHGKAGVAEFSDAMATGDPEVRRVRDMISVRTDDSIRDDEAWLFITINKTGKSASSSVHVDHATGSLARPMTRNDLNEKFLRQAEGYMCSRANKVVDVCWKLDAESDVSGFVSSLSV